MVMVKRVFLDTWLVIFLTLLNAAAVSGFLSGVPFLLPGFPQALAGRRRQQPLPDDLSFRHEELRPGRYYRRTRQHRQENGGDAVPEMAEQFVNGIKIAPVRF